MRILAPAIAALLILAGPAAAERLRPCGTALCAELTAGGLTVSVRSEFLSPAGSRTTISWSGAEQEWRAPAHAEFGVVVDRAWLARTARGYELVLAGAVATGGSGATADLALLRLAVDRWQTVWELGARPRVFRLPRWLPASQGDTAIVTTGEGARVLRLVDYAFADERRTGLQEAHAGPHIKVANLLVRKPNGYDALGALPDETPYLQVFYAMWDLRTPGDDMRVNASSETLDAMRAAGLASGSWLPSPARGGFVLCGVPDLAPALFVPVVATEQGWGLLPPRARASC